MQRTVDVPWQEFVELDTVRLTSHDVEVTPIDFSEPVQVHEASEVSDADGTRRAALLFQQGTVATMDLPDGTSQVLPSIQRTSDRVHGG